MAHIFKLRGGGALAQFRLEKLLGAAQEIGLPNLVLHSEFWHLAECETALSAEEQTLLGRLLEYGEPTTKDEPQGELFLVTPRLGTLSPWASKATDIAHHCGLSSVLRIERATAFWVSGASLTPGSRAALSALLHDRMTETVLTHLAW